MDVEKEKKIRLEDPTLIFPVQLLPFDSSYENYINETPKSINSGVWLDGELCLGVTTLL
jgi:hypothetical protein